jgi:hypothetical protein
MNSLREEFGVAERQLKMVPEPGRQNEKYWQDMNSRFEQSGLCLKKFCQAEGITYHTFQYQRSKLNQKSKSSRPTKVETGALVPVVVRADASDAQVIEVRTAKGHVVSIPVAVCGDVIEAIFRAIGKL